MKGVILDRASLGSDVDLSPLTKLINDCQIYDFSQADEVEEKISACDIVLTNKIALTRKHFEACPNLKFVGVLATGMNNIDLEAAQERGLKVVNVQNYATYTVAQHTMSLMLALATRLVNYQAAVWAGQWSQSKIFCLLDYPIIDLAGKNLLLVGYGPIGQKVAQLAQAFGMNILVAQLPGYAAKDKKVKRYPFDQALAQADVLSLHCPLTPENHHLIDAAALAKMKASAFIINTSRGGLIDELALLAALKDAKLAGAALDVLSQEPPSLTHPLIKARLENLIITPHSAWASQLARQRLIDRMAENIAAFQREGNWGKTLL